MSGTILLSSLKDLMLVTDDKCPSSKRKRPKFLTLTLYVVTSCQCPYMKVIRKFVVAVTFTVILNPLFAIRPETENRLLKVPITLVNTQNVSVTKIVDFLFNSMC